MDARLRLAIESGDVNMLHNYIQTNGTTFNHEFNPMHLAVFRGNVHALLELLRLQPSYARQLNKQGHTPLHMALMMGRDDIAVSMIKRSPELIRIPGKNGITPFHCAVKKGNVDTVKELLFSCPHAIEDLTVFGETTLHIALMNDKVDVFELLMNNLKSACYPGSSKQQYGILNAQDDNHRNTVLHIAASTGRVEVVRSLLTSGAESNLKNSQDLTPIDVAVNAQVRVLFAEKTSAAWEERQDSYIVSYMRFRCKMSNGVINVTVPFASIITMVALQAILTPSGGFRDGTGKVVMSGISFVIHVLIFFFCLLTTAAIVFFIIMGYRQQLFLTRLFAVLVYLLFIIFAFLTGTVAPNLEYTVGCVMFSLLGPLIPLILVKRLSDEIERKIKDNSLIME